MIDVIQCTRGYILFWSSSRGRNSRLVKNVADEANFERLRIDNSKWIIYLFIIYLVSIRLANNILWDYHWQKKKLNVDSCHGDYQRDSNRLFHIQFIQQHQTTSDTSWRNTRTSVFKSDFYFFYDKWTAYF